MKTAKCWICEKKFKITSWQIRSKYSKEPVEVCFSCLVALKFLNQVINTLMFSYPKIKRPRLMEMVDTLQEELNESK